MTATAAGWRKPLVWGAQVALVIGVGFFLWKNLSVNWADLRPLDETIDVHVGWITLAAVCVWSAYALLIGAWRSVLKGWGQQLSPVRAAAIWCLSNLGRYLPGKVWAVAGMAVLAGRAGINGYAAVGSAVAMQALALGSGVGVVAAFGFGTTPATTAVLAGGFGAMIILTLVLPAPARWIGKITGRDFQPLPAQAAFSGAVTTIVSWLLYGAAFWFLARGLGLQLDYRMATTAFTSSYIAGLVAVFAPGGIIMRETAIVAALSGVMGPSGAIALSIASRILFTLTEITVALAALPFAKGLKETAGD